MFIPVMQFDKSYFRSPGTTTGLISCFMDLHGSMTNRKLLGFRVFLKKLVQQFETDTFCITKHQDSPRIRSCWTMMQVGSQRFLDDMDLSCILSLFLFNCLAMLYWSLQRWTYPFQDKFILMLIGKLSWAAICFRRVVPISSKLRMCLWTPWVYLGDLLARDVPWAAVYSVYQLRQMIGMSASSKQVQKLFY